MSGSTQTCVVGAPHMQPMTVWKLKMAASAAIDASDFLVGALPIAGHLKEVLTIPVAMALWGWRGSFYSLELLDVTNMVDALAPTALAIGWSKRAEYEQRQREWEAQQPSAPVRSLVPIPAE